MLRLIGIAVSIGLADSLNPTTIAPGLYLAMGRNGRSGLIQFTLAVFTVNLVGGAAIALGPGQALLALVPHPSATARYILETVAGVVMLIGAAVLWRRRKRLAQRKLPEPSSTGRSALVLGLTVSAVELPTAFPYFAVIAAAVGSGRADSWAGPGRAPALLADRAGRSRAARRRVRDRARHHRPGRTQSRPGRARLEEGAPGHLSLTGPPPHARPLRSSIDRANLTNRGAGGTGRLR